MSSTKQLRSAADRLMELHESGDLDGVLALADEVTELAGGWEQPDEVVRESLFIARFQRAMVLTEREQLDEAANAYAEAADTPTDPDDPDQRHEIAMALLYRGMCLDALGEAAAALRVYDQVVERFGDADDPVTRDQVVRARVNRAVALLSGGDAEAAVEEARRVAAGMDRTMPLDAEQWLMSRRVEAAALQALGRAQDALEALSATGVIELDDPAVLEQQAMAHLDRAQLLEELGRSDAATAARAAADAVGPQA